MKKYSWIVALLIALSLAFIGCPGDSGGGGDSNDPDDPNNPDNPGKPIVKTIELEANGYGDGFQYKMQAKDGKILEGDKFALKMTFTIDRDVLKVGTGKGVIGAGLVDTVTDYWNPLSWSDDDDIEMFYTEPNLVKGTEYTIDTVLEALKDSGGDSSSHNMLILQTEHEFTPANSGGTDNSGVDKLIIKCTVFEFGQVEEED